MKFKWSGAVLTILAIAAVSGVTHAQELRGRTIHNGTIVNVGSRLCIEVAQASLQEGARLQQGECRSGQSEWEVRELGNDEVAIQNRSSGLVMDVQQSSAQDGATVQQWSWNQSSAQRWRLDLSAAGRYRIVNVGSGKCLDVEGRSNTAGAKISQYQCHGGENQAFRFDRFANATPPVSVPVPPPASPVPAVSSVRAPGRTLYTGMIHSRATDKCVDVERASTAEGANVFQWSCNATAAQIWDVVDLGRNEIAFIAQASNKVMDVQGGDRRSGADVRQYSWNGSPTQRWRMENVERGFSKIVNVGSGKCLDLDGAQNNDGAEIAQHDCHGGANQQWRIEVSGNDADWRGYNAGRPWGSRNPAYSEPPPAFLVGDFKAFNNYYRADIQLSIYSDGVVIATLDGGQRVTGYYRGGQLFLGNARFDVQQETAGFRAVQAGQPSNVTAYARVRYESPRGR